MLQKFPEILYQHSAAITALHNLAALCHSQWTMHGRDGQILNMLTSSDIALQMRLDQALQNACSIARQHYWQPHSEKRSSPQRKAFVFAICSALLRLLSVFFNVPQHDLLSQNRGKSYVSRIRQFGMYIAHVTFGLSMSEVALAFSRERTTVKHACHLIEDLREDHAFDQAASAFEYLISLYFLFEERQCDGRS